MRAAFVPALILAALALPAPPATADGPASALCDNGTRLTDTTSQGVRVKAYVTQSGIRRFDLCVRVEDATTGTGIGGRLWVWNGLFEPTVIRAPYGEVGSTVHDRCATATGNQLPGSHPIVSAGVGDVTLVVDAYLTTSELWLCAGVPEMATGLRVIVPLDNTHLLGPIPPVGFDQDPPA